MKFLLVGLGNIGDAYAHTRHNIGFDVLDAFAAKHGAAFKTDRLADVAEVKLKGKQLFLVKPSTYMNLSGKAVKYWMEKEKIPVEQVLVIVDDLAISLEKLRLRPGGSDAGHNGLKSIQEQLLTVDYPRLRFGIGNQFPKGGQVDFVLGKWSAEELPIVMKKMDYCITAIESFVLIGMEKTMNTVNRYTAAE